MNTKSVASNAISEPEWILSDLRNLGEAIGMDMIRKYDLMTKIEALEGKMTSEELAVEGEKLVKMGYALSMEVQALDKKLKTLLGTVEA